MTRREAVQGIFGGVPAVARQWPHRKNTSAHHQDESLYRGPFAVPEHIYESLREDPVLVKTTCRKLAIRYADRAGTVWLGRCPVPAHRGVVGEIVRTPQGKIRIHWWSAAEPSATYRTPDEMLARRKNVSELPAEYTGDASYGRNRAGGPIMPPLMAPVQPAWKEPA